MFTTQQIITIILIVLLIFVLVQNSYTVTMKFLFMSVSMPLSILVFSVFMVGVLIGYFLNRKKTRVGR